MAYVQPGAHNVFVPDHEASNSLVVDFSRNVESFKINQYAQIVPVKKPDGLYLKMTVEEAGRILSTDGAEFAWPDGNDAPDGRGDTESFSFLAYRAERKAYPVPLGNLTVEHATWDIRAQHAAIKSQQAMTMRTQKVVTAATTSGNYDSAHTSAVASIPGNTGTWAASTTARQDIKRSINYAREKILESTLGAVKADQLAMVINPEDAHTIAETQELVDYIKHSPEAMAQIKGDIPGANKNWGLPDHLYGMKLIVEDSYKVTSRKGASSTTRAPVLAQGSAFVCSRVGGLEGVYGSPSFTTLQQFMLEEMTVEYKDDTDNRLTRVRVVENYDVKLVAPASGFLFTSIA